MPSDLAAALLEDLDQLEGELDRLLPVQPAKANINQSKKQHKNSQYPRQRRARSTAASSTWLGGWVVGWLGGSMVVGWGISSDGVIQQYPQSNDRKGYLSTDSVTTPDRQQRARLAWGRRTTRSSRRGHRLPSRTTHRRTRSHPRRSARGAWNTNPIVVAGVRDMGTRHMEVSHPVKVAL